MTDYTDKLADAAGEGLDLESARHYARGSFALGLLLLGVTEEEEEAIEPPLATVRTILRFRVLASTSKS